MEWNDIFQLRSNEAGHKKPKDWVKNVETKVEVGEGFFKENSAEQIAKKMKSKHKGDVGKTILALNFQLNRNKNQSEEIKKKIRRAIEILRDENKKPKEKKVAL